MTETIRFKYKMIEILILIVDRNIFYFDLLVLSLKNLGNPISIWITNPNVLYIILRFMTIPATKCYFLWLLVLLINFN